MVGSKDLPPSAVPFSHVFINNQFRAKPQWPAPGTSLAGKTAIVTGGNTGLGFEAASQLLDLGLSRLILAVRSAARGEAAASKLRPAHPKATVEVWDLDMASYDSVRAFARRVDAQLGRVDLVLLNAGVIRMKYLAVDATGHNEAVQVNYLSTVLLATLLLPVLRSKHAANGGDSPPHLTIVSAALTLAAKFLNRDKDPLLASFDDEKAYDAEESYNSSKLLMHMWLWKLVDYVGADDVVVNLADPAWVRSTGLSRDVSGPLKVAVKVFGAAAGRSPKVGASCLVDALVNKGKESHGCFIMSWQIHP